MNNTHQDTDLSLPGFPVSSESMAIPLDSFLDCPQKHDNISQVKGIYYDDELQTFFIFIKHYYLQIGEDLVKKGFRDIFVGDYINQAKALEFESYEVAKSVLFDDLVTKWV